MRKRKIEGRREFKYQDCIISAHLDIQILIDFVVDN